MRLGLFRGAAVWAARKLYSASLHRDTSWHRDIHVRMS